MKKLNTWVHLDRKEEQSINQGNYKKQAFTAH